MAHWPNFDIWRRVIYRQVSLDHTRYSEAFRGWVFFGGVTLGLGIWSMHFMGMLAWHPPFDLYY